MTIGFDPVQGAFLGTFVASMMTHLWLVSRHAGGRHADARHRGTGFRRRGGWRSYQDIIALQGDDARTLTSRMQTRGRHLAVEVMSARYRRIG